MRYVVNDCSLENFHFWSGAKDTANLLTSEEFQMIEDYITECEDGEGRDWTETEINDFIWFEDEVIEDIIGRKLYPDEDEDSEEDEDEGE